MAASFLSNCYSPTKRQQSMYSRVKVPSANQTTDGTTGLRIHNRAAGLRQRLRELVFPLSGVASPAFVFTALAIALYLLLWVDRIVSQEAQHAQSSPRFDRQPNRSHPRTDDALLGLAHPERATYLFLEGADISDRGMQVLWKAGRLIVLEISHTNITGASLREISKLQELEGLFLRYLDIQDDDLIHLKGTRLKVLSLAGTLVTDAGLQHLLAIPELKHLSLNDTAVTDTGLATVQKMPCLTSLRLRGTAVTEHGVRALRAARSELEIIWDRNVPMR